LPSPVISGQIEIRRYFQVHDTFKQNHPPNLFPYDIMSLFSYLFQVGLQTMPRGFQLTKEQEAQVDALHHAGHSIRQIGKQMGKSATCIHNCIKRKELGVEIVRSGRPRVTSDHDHRRIIRAVSNKTVSARKVKHDLNLNCSPSTIRNIIKASGHIVYAKKVKKPILSGEQCQTRVDWCRQDGKEWSSATKRSLI
jgi:IS30 family transposase